MMATFLDGDLPLLTVCITGAVEHADAVLPTIPRRDGVVRSIDRDVWVRLLAKTAGLHVQLLDLLVVGERRWCSLDGEGHERLCG